MKTVQQTATRQAPPFEGKPAWYGLYWQDEQWNYVCNANGDCIIYTEPEFAITAAEHERAK